MFKNYFFLGLTSAILATIVGVLFTFGYIDLANFFDGKPVWYFALLFFAKSILFTLSASIIYFFLNCIAKIKFADFIVSFLFALVCLVSVFVILKSEDPKFVTDNANDNSFAYKAYAFAMFDFIAISWYALKSLFIRPE